MCITKIIYLLESKFYIYINIYIYFSVSTSLFPCIYIFFTISSLLPLTWYKTFIYSFCKILIKQLGTGKYFIRSDTWTIAFRCWINLLRKKKKEHCNILMHESQAKTTFYKANQIFDILAQWQSNISLFWMRKVSDYIHNPHIISNTYNWKQKFFISGRSRYLGQTWLEPSKNINIFQVSTKCYRKNKHKSERVPAFKSLLSDRGKKIAQASGKIYPHRKL